MALQPAAGARDLNPREVEQNRQLCLRLSEVYRLWGYQEVAPPHFEHLNTLAAGGGIDGRELVRLASDEPLGLRPELTASITRAACTRLAARPRPLRLWAEGPTFRCQQGESGQRIVAELQSGVELLGEPSAAADAELLRLLLAASAATGLGSEHQPRLLLGHHGLLRVLLAQVAPDQHATARAALTGFDPLALDRLAVPESQRQRLSALMRLRGEPIEVLDQLRQWLGSTGLLAELADTLALIAPTARRLGVVVQLDPSFQPHFALYDGLVLKLVCQGATAPVAVASGGRYDALVGRFSGDAGDQQAAGMGFGFDVAALREVLAPAQRQTERDSTTLVCIASGDQLDRALNELEALHRAGQRAELHGQPLASQAEAQALAAARGCGRAVWIHAA